MITIFILWHGYLKLVNTIHELFEIMKEQEKHNTYRNYLLSKMYVPIFLKPDQIQSVLA